MATKSDLYDKLGILTETLSQYHEWYADAIAVSRYETDMPNEPQGFKNWIKATDFAPFNTDDCYDDVADKLCARHDTLMQEAKSLFEDNTLEQFEKLSYFYRAFTEDVQRFMRAIVLEQNGTDRLTGLNNNCILERDFQTEMERFSREGHPFCVGLARIDEFEDIEKNLGREVADELIVKISHLIQKSLRSYDEAFRIKRHQFILLLKQSDIVGGQKAFIRLRNILEAAGETYKVKNKEEAISLSCCVAAPLPDDSFEDLMDNLCFDLDKQIKESGSVLTYQELSPLQRFVKEEQQG